MKLYITSDLHLECFPDPSRSTFLQKIGKGNDHQKDVLIVAGDLATKEILRSALELLSCRFLGVIYVFGNHEYYHSSFTETRELLRYVPDDVYVLDRKVVIIKKQRFVGATLWFPNDPLNQVYEHQLNDFNYIKDFREQVYKEGKLDREFLARTVLEGDIVITHHLPSLDLVPERFKGSNLNRFFVTPMDELIVKEKPKLWIFGHTHNSVKMKIGKTKMLANPYGYFNSKSNYDSNAEFDSNLKVTI